jgi:hypothetical protein
MVFNNYGTFRKSGGTSEFATATFFQPGVIFNQLAGVIDVQNGTNGLQLAIQGGGNFTGGYITTNQFGLTTLEVSYFTINGTVTGTNTWETDNGNMAGTNIINGGLNWLSGVWNGAVVTIASNCTVVIAGGKGNNNMNGTVVTNYGTVAWASGTIQGGNGTAIYNYGLWDAQSDQQMNTAYGNNGWVFNNFGTFRKSGGGPEFSNYTAITSGVVFNQLAGAIDVQNGTNGLQLAIQGGGNFTGGYITTNQFGLTVLNSGSFTLNGTVTGTNTLEDAGNLVGTNIINGGLTWVAGNWNGAAFVTIATNTTLIVAGGMIALGGTGNNNMNGTVMTNYGAVAWASGTIVGANGTAIYNYGLWDAQSDQLMNIAFGNSAMVFNNYGTFRKSGGASEFANYTIFQTGVIFNQLAGVIDVQNGTNGLELAFQGGGNFTGGYITTNQFGLTVLSTGNFTLNGTVTGTNTWETAGNLVGANVINGGLTWVAGNWNSPAAVTIATNSTLIVAGGLIGFGTGNNNLNGTVVTNYGTVAWASGTIQGGNGTAIYNYGLWNAQSDQQMNNNFGGSTTFNNYGTFRKSAGTEPNSTSFQSGVGFVNDGTVDAQNGLLQFSGSFANTASTLAVENGATIQIAQAVVLPGGLVTGSGTVQAPSITSSAVVSPGATNAVLNLAGNYNQLLGGSIQFDIGGTSPGVNQSQVNITGAANLNGLIALRFSPGYVPAVNSSNLVLTAASRTGPFPFQDHFYLLGQNKRIIPVYSPTNLVLTTIAAADPTNFSLSAAVQGQTFTLAWPSEFGGYDLETKTNLEDSTWTSVPGVTNFYSETPMTSPHKFFRLFPAL